MEGGKEHPIAVVAKQTGLSLHVIRAWERRYRAVLPERTATNRRLYSDEDIRRLLLLKTALSTGRSIGQIAHLPRERLEELLGTDPGLHPGPAPLPAGDEPARSHLEAALRAVDGLDPAALDESLSRSSVDLGVPAALLRVVAPLIREIGTRWHSGSLRILHEHAATAVIRTFLGDTLRSLAPPASAPAAVVSTPSGEAHELGALIGAVLAASRGWNPVYLGPGVPAEELAQAVQVSGACLLILSVVYVPDEGKLGHELGRIRRLLPPGVRVVCSLPSAIREGDGGGQVAGLRRRLEEQGFIPADDYPALLHVLDTFSG